MRSLAQSTMLVCRRGPSSSSMMATLYGTSLLKAGCCDWCTTIQLNTVPRPLSATHSARSDRQRAHSSAGGNRMWPQSPQRCMRSSPLWAASQNGALSSVGRGSGFSMANIFSPQWWSARQHERAVADGRRGLVRGAAVAGDQTELRAGDLTLAGLAAQLADGFADVAEPGEMSLGDQPSGGVRRQRAAEIEAAGLDEAPDLLRRAEAVRDQVVHHARREGIV